MKPVPKQSETSSRTQKRLRSLTVESEYDFMQNERDQTIQELRTELILRLSSLEQKQKQEELQVQGEIVEDTGGISLKSVWNGFKSAFI